MSKLFDTKQLKFTIVGALNTAIDFSIFIILTTLGFNSIFANIISTSCGMGCSFLLNRSFVFGSSNSKTHVEIVKFLGITLIGLWVIQNIIIIGCNWLFGSLFAIRHDIILNLISKLLATGASLVWNYYWYKNYVFKEKSA